MAKKQEFDLTLLEARERVAKIVLRAQIPGLKGHRWDMSPKTATQQTLLEARSGIWGHLYFNYEQAWGLGACLSCEFKDEKRAVPGGIQKQKYAQCSVLHVKVSWSSTGRSLSEARAAVVLYSQVVDLACMVEAHMNGLVIQSSSAAYDIERAKRKAKRDKELASERETYVAGFGVEYHNAPKEVSTELWEHLMGEQCGGETGKGDQCKAKSRVAVFVIASKRFVPRCMRHCEHDKATGFDGLDIKEVEAA